MVNNIINNIHNIYINKIIECNQIDDGSKIRTIKGDLVENITFNIIKDICKLNNIPETEYKLYKGKQNPKRCHSKNGYIDVSVDVHFDIGKYSLYIENKAQVDKCYLDRSHSDLSKLKKETSFGIVVALENDIKQESLNYFLDKKGLDGVFFLVDGKRSSKNPIWAEDNFKTINTEKLKTLIQFIDNFIKLAKEEKELWTEYNK
jgi:hypothetical protein